MNNRLRADDDERFKPVFALIRHVGDKLETTHDKRSFYAAVKRLAAKLEYQNLTEAEIERRDAIRYYTSQIYAQAKALAGQD